MKSFKGLTGDELEEWFTKLFQNNFLFENYVPSSGQISLNDIDPAQAAGEHLELDGLLLVDRTCIVLEFTDQKSKFKQKKMKINLFLKLKF